MLNLCSTKHEGTRTGGKKGHDTYLWSHGLIVLKKTAPRWWVGWKKWKWKVVKWKCEGHRILEIILVSNHLSYRTTISPAGCKVQEKGRNRDEIVSGIRRSYYVSVEGVSEWMKAKQVRDWLRDTVVAHSGQGPHIAHSKYTQHAPNTQTERTAHTASTHIHAARRANTGHTGEGT